MIEFRYLVPDFQANLAGDPVGALFRAQDTIRFLKGSVDLC